MLFLLPETLFPPSLDSWIYSFIRPQHKWMSPGKSSLTHRISILQYWWHMSLQLFSGVCIFHYFPHWPAAAKPREVRCPLSPPPTRQAHSKLSIDNYWTHARMNEIIVMNNEKIQWLKIYFIICLATSTKYFGVSTSFTIVPGDTCHIHI